MITWMRRALAPAPEKKDTVLRQLVALRDLDVFAGSRPDYARLAGKGYARNPVAFRCVRLVAEAAASIPFRVRRAGAPALADDPAAIVMGAPNRDQSWGEVLEGFYGHLQVAGNAFLEGVALDGVVRELYALRPDRLKVAEGKRGWALGWDYTVDGQTRRYAPDPVTGRSRLLHIKVFNPGDDHYGLSPMEAAYFAVETHNAAGAWNRALLENAARPSGALVFTGTSGGDRLTDEQFDRLKAELSEIHAGPKGAGRPLLLEGGLDWRPFGLSPADMDFVDAKNIAAREIALAFGVPPMLLGIPGDNTYANYKEANLAFWRQTILPLARKTARAVERWLQPWFGSDLQIRTDEDDVPALAEERGLLWKRLADADFMTTTERRRLAGLPSAPAADTSA